MQNISAMVGYNLLPWRARCARYQNRQLWLIFILSVALPLGLVERWHMYLDQSIKDTQLRFAALQQKSLSTSQTKVFPEVIQQDLISPLLTILNQLSSFGLCVRRLERREREMNITLESYSNDQLFLLLQRLKESHKFRSMHVKKVKSLSVNHAIYQFILFL